MAGRAAARLGLAVCATAALPGCGLQKGAQPQTVLRTEDFIADPTTTPTELRPARAPTLAAAPPAVTAIGASDQGEPLGDAPAITPEEARSGVGEVVLEPGDPHLGVSAEAAEPPVLVDAKVGEINGRAIRVGDVLDENMGSRLAEKARTRELTTDDRITMARMGYAESARAATITRAVWLDFASALIKAYLAEQLQSELLEAEGRASLTKPEQQMGLRYMVQEFSEEARRAEGGSRAALARQEGKSQEQIRRQQESLVLARYQYQREIEKRVRVSWKDIQVYYERHVDDFNPPPAASFRMIRVPTADAAAVEKISAALAAPGARFEDVARLPENRSNGASGGLEGPKRFTGEYAEGRFYAEPLNTAARGLTAGQWAGPLQLGSDTYWLYLEAIRQINRPLTDRDVQLEIADILTRSARDAAAEAYFGRLMERASYSDTDEMTRKLVAIAAARYWPE
jgi:hypothetical protein